MRHVFDIEPEFVELYELCREQTMTSIERMRIDGQPLEPGASITR